MISFVTISQPENSTDQFLPPEKSNIDHLLRFSDINMINNKEVYARNAKETVPKGKREKDAAEMAEKQRKNIPRQHPVDIRATA
ncbi:hypothetical protein HHI36_011139 [Cryptolaemus montrouzieri]|uniref:Uncharacterized protein n=1 Tax=Cryptolaemus montrouzieri TaxID=559131 RepID=A0ABD2MKV4_9CUCU